MNVIRDDADLGPSQDFDQFTEDCKARYTAVMALQGTLSCNTSRAKD